MIIKFNKQCTLCNCDVYVLTSSTKMTWIWRGIKTVGLVLFYYIFSIGLTFYNKKLLTTFPFPVSITIIHLVVKFLLAWLVRRVVAVFSKEPPIVLTWPQYLRNICAVAVFSSLDIGLSNWSLVYITVSLYTMSKSTALIFILLFALLFRLEKPRLSQMAIVVFIVVGLFMFTFKSTSFDTEGFVLVLLASVLTGVRWTTAQLVLQKKELSLSNPVDTVFHLQPVMILTLIPLACFIDGVHLGTSRRIFLADTASTFTVSFLVLMAGALVSFMLAVSEYLLVYHTSSLTLSVAGVVKEILILSISTTLIDEDKLSWVNIVGIVLCVMGVVVHTVFKALWARQDDKAFKTTTEPQEDTEELIARHKARKKGTIQLVNEEGTSDSEDSIILYDTRM